MRYRVLSDRLPVPKGQLVEDIPGADLAALVAAGHLAPVTKKAPSAPDQGGDG